MIKINEILLEKSRKGLPCTWESGGGYTNTGNAIIIANRDGSPKKPIYIRRRGELACMEHALFVVQEGDIIVAAEHHRSDFEIHVFRIAAIQEGDEHTPFFADLDPIHHFDRGEWDIEPTGMIADAVEAAIEKAQHYHCRTPYYYVEQETA